MGLDGFSLPSSGPRPPTFKLTPLKNLNALFCPVGMEPVGYYLSVGPNRRFLVTFIVFFGNDSQPLGSDIIHYISFYLILVKSVTYIHLIGVGCFSILLYPKWITGCQWGLY